ncbi:MAG: hypothetical protein WCJ58_03310 [bacterium]
MTRDYILYLARLQRKTLFELGVNAFIFFFIVLEFLTSWTSIRESVGLFAIFLLAALNFFWGFYSMIRDLKNFLTHEESYIEQASYIIHPTYGKITLTDLEPSEYEKSNEFQKTQINVADLNFPETVFYSNKINRYFWDNELGLIFDGKKQHQVKDLIKQEKNELLEFLKNRFTYSRKNRKIFYNGRMLCLSRDLDINNGVAHVFEGEYFDNYVTNEISSSQLCDSETSRVLVDGTKFFPLEEDIDSKPTVSCITNSNLQNLIGACTLAFTKDNYLVIWKQNMRVQQSNNLLVPSGSGSADLRDVEASNFNKTLINTMHRELVEESMLDLDPHDIGNTKILGYYRWVRRGGLPEFAGITKVNLSVADFRPETMEVQVPKTANKFFVDSLEKLEKVIDKFLNDSQGEISVPLHMNLLFLKYYMQERHTDLEKFLFGEI